MTLTCAMKSGGQNVVTIPLDPPLSGYGEVKLRLLEMKAEAQEGLGMIQAPQLKAFHLPSAVLKTLFPILALIYCTLYSPEKSSPLFVPARFILPLVGGDYTVKLAWITVVLLHGLESFYTYSLCKKHKTGFFVGAAYVIATLLFGFPVWTDMRKRIQTMRIDSVMKVE
ncbi:hypothetical protein HGRIS_010874 [Hohenbuehelia grisea]|uniref:Uncharacterized protein n=1 Tax=Hohenbuehelia grisea TaxID=104357 RepID=A0ABR3IYK0_9AGAR